MPTAAVRQLPAKTDELDLDAIAAEGLKTGMHFRKAGKRWMLAAIQHVDYRMVELADSGELSAVRGAIELGLGADQWAEFESLPLSVAELDALFKAWLKHSGMAPGESPASSQSLGSTATLSKPTSRARAARSPKSGRAR